MYGVGGGVDEQARRSQADSWREIDELPLAGILLKGTQESQRNKYDIYVKTLKLWIIVNNFVAHVDQMQSSQWNPLSR